MLGKILLGGLVGYAIGKHSQRTPIDADSDGHYSIETGGDDCHDHSSLINPNRR